MNGTIASCPWFGGQAGGAAKAYAALYRGGRYHL